MLKAPIIIASRARRTIATGRTDMRPMHTGAKSGRVKPTRTTPTINLTPNDACSIDRWVVVMVLCPADHNRNCSSHTLASWSDKVESTSVAWQAAGDDGIIRFMKLANAHKAANNRNNMRASLWPSQIIGYPRFLRYTIRALDAACSKRPLSDVSWNNMAGGYFQTNNENAADKV